MEIIKHGKTYETSREKVCPKCGSMDIFVKRDMMANYFICRKCGYE